MGNCETNVALINQIGLYEFKSNHIVGSGQHGTVYKGYPMNNLRFPVAIKCLNQPYTSKEFDAVRPILTKLVAVEGDNISKYTDYYHDHEHSKLYLISQYSSYGNLNDLIMTELKIDPLEDLRTAIIYCQQLIQGLLTLHRNHIIHGRLNPKNVLIDCRKLKINDFGLYKLERPDGKTSSTVYDAPELISNSMDPTEKSDIWSLGIIMYHLVYKINPIKIIGGEHVFFNLQWGKCDVFDDLAKKCLKMNPHERISSQDLELHPLLSFSPQDIQFISNKWANTRPMDSPSPYTAHKIFHQMEMGFNFSSV